MKLSRAARRPGFTLLEVMLASVLAVLLMAALHVALDVQLRLAASGREAIEEATLTRAIVQRLDNDLACSVAPVSPPIVKGGSTGSSGAATGATGATGAPGGTGSSTPSTGATAASSDPTAVMDAANTTATMPFQAGVIGETDRITIFVSKVAGLGKPGDENPEAAAPSDIRRVTYWMTDTGLARQEIPWVTSENVQNSTDPDFSEGKEERDYVIAEEVTRLQFEYWDGSQWLDTWDGRAMNDDGKTLKGPPMAIRVHFWLTVPGTDPGETVEKEIRHTIAVRGAPGPGVTDNEAAAAAAASASTTSSP